MDVAGDRWTAGGEWICIEDCCSSSAVWEDTADGVNVDVCNVKAHGSIGCSLRKLFQ